MTVAACEAVSVLCAAANREQHRYMSAHTGGEEKLV